MEDYLNSVCKELIVDNRDIIPIIGRIHVVLLIIIFKKAYITQMEAVNGQYNEFGN
jgi:hypothetical protein